MPKRDRVAGTWPGLRGLSKRLRENGIPRSQVPPRPRGHPGRYLPVLALLDARAAQDCTMRPWRMCNSALKLMDVDAVARAVGVTPRTVRNWRTTGRRSYPR